MFSRIFYIYGAKAWARGCAAEATRTQDHGLLGQVPFLGQAHLGGPARPDMEVRVAWMALSQVTPWCNIKSSVPGIFNDKFVVCGIFGSEKLLRPAWVFDSVALLPAASSAENPASLRLLTSNFFTHRVRLALVGALRQNLCCSKITL